MLQDRPAQNSMTLQPVDAEEARRDVAFDQNLLGLFQNLESRLKRRPVRIARLLRPEQRRLERGISLDVFMVAVLSAEKQDVVPISKLQFGYFRSQLQIGAYLVARAFAHIGIFRDQALC